MDFLADGSTVKEILQEYPQLSKEDVQACIGYGAEAAREHFIHVAMEQ